MTDKPPTPEAQQEREPRRPLSKRLRFEIFKRDGFRCIYCGATPLQSELHVDHVVPVASGGTDDMANLVTACIACNLGKAAVPLDQKTALAIVSESDRDRPDQIREYLRVQRELAAAKAQISEAFELHWREAVGYEPDPALLSRLPYLIEEFGFARLLEAVDIVGHKRIRSSHEQTATRNQAKYFHGILRYWREGGGQ